jgi:hypothetical protein
MKFKKMFSLFKKKNKKIDLIIFLLAIVVIAVGMRPQI